MRQSKLNALLLATVLTFTVLAPAVADAKTNMQQEIEKHSMANAMREQREWQREYVHHGPFNDHNDRHHHDDKGKYNYRKWRLYFDDDYYYGGYGASCYFPTPVDYSDYPQTITVPTGTDVNVLTNVPVVVAIQQ